MDFNTRAAQPQPVQSGTPFAAPTNRKTKAGRNKWLKWGSGTLFLVILLLVVALLVSLSLGGPKPEANYVNPTKLQAVFLNTGQVYFGNIKNLNQRYLVLDNIYYLQTSGGSTTAGTTAANSSVSLVKLGCELHSPYDQMVINRTQVTFWENLQDTGQVAKAVQAFEKQNPNGQKCVDQSQSSNTGSTGVQGSNPSVTPATTTPVTKKP